MTKKLSRILLCLLFAALTTAWALAQEDTSNGSKGEVRNVTGCLTKSGGGDEYLLTASDGSTWEIHDKNSSADLAEHANQTVEVRGVISHSKTHNMKEDAKDMAHDTGATKAHAEHGHLTVTEVHKVSSTCNQ